jgi:hypothetical protein
MADARQSCGEAGDAMGIELLDVSPSDRLKLVTRLDAYLSELAGYREIAVGAINASDDPYLDAYFHEPGRHAFFIAERRVVVGFVFVRGPESTGSAWEIAELYVTPIESPARDRWCGAPDPVEQICWRLGAAGPCAQRCRRGFLDCLRRSGGVDGAEGHARQCS